LSTSYGHSIFGSESAALKEAADLTKFKRICMQTFQRAAQHTAIRTLETKIRSFTFQLFAIRFYESGGRVFPDSELAVSQFWSLMDVQIQSPFTGSRLRLGKSDITPNINEVKDFNSHGIYCCAHGSVTDAASCGLTTAQCEWMRSSGGNGCVFVNGVGIGHTSYKLNMEAAIRRYYPQRAAVHLPTAYGLPSVAPRAGTPLVSPATPAAGPQLPQAGSARLRELEAAAAKRKTNLKAKRERYRKRKAAKRQAEAKTETKTGAVRGRGAAGATARPPVA
jgi:hypothetical protein